MKLSVNKNLQVRWECSCWENNERQEIKLLLMFSFLCSFLFFSLLPFSEREQSFLSL